MTREIKLSTQELLIAEGMLVRAESQRAQMLNKGAYSQNVAQLASTAAAKAIALLPEHEDVCKIIMGNMVTVIASADANHLMLQQSSNEVIKLQKEVERLTQALEDAGVNVEQQAEADK